MAFQDYYPHLGAKAKLQQKPAGPAILPAVIQ